MPTDQTLTVEDSGLYKSPFYIGKPSLYITENYDVLTITSSLFSD